MAGYPDTSGDDIASLQGTMVQPLQSPSLMDIMGRVGMGAGIIAHGKAEAEKPQPVVTMKTGDDGKPYTTIENIDADSLQQVMGAINFQKQAMQGYQEELGKLNQQENRLSHGMGPIFNALATVGGNLAVADPRLPPVVRALGQTAKDLNPTLEQIRARKMPVLNQMGELGGQMERLGIARQEGELRAQTEARHEATDEKRFGLSYMSNLRAQAKDEAFSTADKESLTQELLDAKVVKTPEQAAARAGSLIAESAARTRIREAEALEKRNEQEERELRADRRLLAGITAANYRADRAQNAKDSKEADKDAEMWQNARGVVAGDPTSLKLYGTRTGDRGSFLAKITQLDPTMTSDKVENAYNATISLGNVEKNGSLGMAVNTFDTFIQHTGELEQLAKKLNLTNSPLLNAPLNKIKREVMGSPELQRFLVVSAAAGKEYEGFLLRNRALYQSDRDELERLLSSNLSIGGLLGTTGEMLKTANARMISLNTGFKRNTRRNLPEDSLSEESKAIMAAHGIQLPLGTGDPSKEPTPAGSDPLGVRR